jgi:hypothetical protein
MEFTLPSHNTNAGAEFLTQCSLFFELNVIADKCSQDNDWMSAIPKHDTKLSLQEKAFMDMSA